MRNLFCLLLLGSSLIGQLGCGGKTSSELPLDGSTGNWDTKAPLPELGNLDQALGPDSVIQKDQGITPDTWTDPAVLQTVMNSITLPTNGSQFARDLDGNGTVENKFGAIFGAISGVGLNLQEQLDFALEMGSVLMLIELLGTSIVNDLNSVAQYHLGEDIDQNATDNFSGYEEFLLALDSPPGITLPGIITNGKFVGGPGTVLAALPLLSGEAPVVLTLQKAFLEADVSPAGMANGIIAGAITETELDTELLPALANLLTSVIVDPNGDPGLIGLVKGLFDINPSDGTITANELKNNPLVKLLFKPDVDTNGDGVVDALSAGIGFTSVSCKINKP
ncbi:MAG: hypothetical protein V1754_05570 [Pseudomonadota bacterium]